MKPSPMYRTIAAILSVSLVAQTAGFAVVSTAQATEATQVAAPYSQGAGAIENALKKMHLQMDSGISKQVAIADFSNTLVNAGVTVADVDQYALLTSSTEEYLNFHKIMSDAIGGMKPESVSGQELGQVLQLAMANSHPEGLSWAGCGGFVAGIALALGAVIVGIIALTKTKSQQKIKNDYDAAIAAENTSYNDNVAYYQNWQTTLPAGIRAQQDAIAYDQGKIQYYNGIIAGASPLDPNYANIIQSASNNITFYNRQISAHNAEMSRLQSLMASFTNNPSALANILSGLKSDHDSQIASLQSAEANAVTSVPEQKKNAGTLGIVAGAAAVIGTVLIIGGKECVE